MNQKNLATFPYKQKILVIQKNFQVRERGGEK